MFTSCEVIMRSSISTRRALFIIVSSFLVWPLSAYAADESQSDAIKVEPGWQAVESVNSALTVQRSNSRGDAFSGSPLESDQNMSQKGDRLYFVEADDTPTSIALLHTGHADHWSSIASYNGRETDSTLGVGDMLLIPATLIDRQSMLKPTQANRSVTHPSASTSPVYGEGRTEDTHTALPVTARAAGQTEVTPKRPSLDQQKQSPRQASVHRSKVDMFVGEIRVYNQIGVNRVAVGNGKLLRAEVLDTGELLLIAEAEGSTSLRLWHHDKTQTDLNIRVGATDPETRFHRETMIRFRVKMVEFRKSALTRLGIDWSDSAAGPSFATAGDLVSNPLFRPASEGFATALPNQVRPFTSHVGIASSLSSRIDFLATNGDAEVLAEPVLSCANGGSARFLAGGEVPYPTTGANGQTTVEFKEYGIRLEVSPRVDEFGHIATDVMTEISSIDPAVTVQGAPGLLTRRTQTQVSVVDGETIVIAGLLKAEASKDIDQLPGIGGIPVLGRLFRSENIRNSLSELVIFITPEISAVATQPLDSNDLTTHLNSNRRLQTVRKQLDFELID